MKLIYVILSITLLLSCKNSSKIIFEENFDSNVLNEKVWNYELGDGCPNLCGWGNNERQLYTRNNVRLENGFLIISATKDSTNYYSGRITTKGKVEIQYGVIEIRAKLATGQGVWPAFWMLGNTIDSEPWPKCGEIDILEYVGKEPHYVYTSLHTQDSHGNTINSKKTKIETIEDGFHTYKAHWTEEKITFYVDDVEVYSFNPPVKNENTWPYNKPFYLLVNLAIGGNFGGPEVDDTIFPQEFSVDYIKIYKH